MAPSEKPLCSCSEPISGTLSCHALLSGAHGLASSVQWLALNPVEREDYRRMGCLEAEAGAAATTS